MNRILDVECHLNIKFSFRKDSFAFFFDFFTLQLIVIRANFPSKSVRLIHEHPSNRKYVRKEITCLCQAVYKIQRRSRGKNAGEKCIENSIKIYYALLNHSSKYLDCKSKPKAFQLSYCKIAIFKCI